MFFKNDEETYIPHISKLEKKEIERIFIRLFRTEDGKKALSYLQYTTFYRALSATATEEQLRHQEGERSIVAKIMRLINS